MNTKHYILTIVLSFAICSKVNSETRMFLPGEKPSISLAQAIEIIEDIIKKTTIKNFNPLSAGLLADEKAKSGVWNFVQHDEGGLVYRFVVYFPDDLCLILDEKNGQKIIGAFKRDGSPVKIEDNKKVEFEDGRDPFGK